MTIGARSGYEYNEPTDSPIFNKEVVNAVNHLLHRSVHIENIPALLRNISDYFLHQMSF